MPKIMKRQDLSVIQRSEILKKYDALKSCSQRSAAIKLGIAQSTLNRLLRDRKKIQESRVNNGNPNRKRQREGKNVTVETALLRWFTKVRTQNAPISRGILMEKAVYFASNLGHEDFKPTDGWLSRWKDRHNIVYKKVCGEKKDGGNLRSEHWIKNCLPGILKYFHQDDIYNTVETGLYFRAIPDYSLVFKKESDAARKKQKERITVLVTCNMSGTDKRKLLVIGKSKNPRCFRGVSLPLTYKNNSNMWMTGEIFRQFLTEWDLELEIKNRKIALFLDNCTAHPNVTLRNIKLVFLPGNTSLIPPLAQGIIKALKTLYRKDMRNLIIGIIDEDNQKQAKDVANSISLLTAVHMIQKAWENVQKSTIINCFRNVGFVTDKNDSDTHETDNYLEVDMCDLDDELKNWINIDEDLPVIQKDSEEDIVASLLEDEQIQEDEIKEEADETSQPPSLNEIRAALLVLRRNLELRGSSAAEFRSFYAVEENAISKIPSRQTTLQSYFNKI